MFRTFAAFAAALMLPTITACGGGTSSTGLGAGSPVSAPTAKPSPTPPPYRNVIASFRAIQKDVGDVSACEGIGRRAHVATIALDGRVPAAYRAMGAPGAA